MPFFNVALYWHHLNPALIGGGFFWSARQGALTWRRKSSTCPARGRVSRTARVSLATANLEEAEGKALARRTGSGYEAARRGKVANIIEARNLNVTLLRISNGHKHEDGCVIPGEVFMSSESNHSATDIERCREAYAEVSRGHSRCQHEQIGRASCRERG